MNVRDRLQIGCCVHFTRGDTCKQARKVGVARILLLCG